MLNDFGQPMVGGKNRILLMVLRGVLMIKG